MQVFGRKGYHAASIQEIAEEAGVAKGSVYLYFKSKDELALSVLTYGYERISRLVMEAGLERGLAPRERFVRQLEVLLRENVSNAEFVMRLWNEQAISINDELKTFLMRVRMGETERLCQSIVSLYGAEAAPYAYDAAIMLQGALVEYMGYGVFCAIPLPPSKLAAFMADRLDNLVAGMIDSGAASMIGERDIRSLQRKLSPDASDRSAWQEGLGELRRAIAALADAELSVSEELEEALAALELESAKGEPQRPVLRGLLQYMRTLAPGLDAAVGRLEKLTP